MHKLPHPSCYWIIKESNLVEFAPGRVFRIDVANMPYRHGISFDAFFNKSRNWNPSKKSAKLIYTRCPEFEFETCDNTVTETMKKHGIEMRWLPIIDIKDVHEFFNIVGYDIKNKKWQ